MIQDGVPFLANRPQTAQQQRRTDHLLHLRRVSRGGRPQEHPLLQKTLRTFCRQRLISRRLHRLRCKTAEIKATRRLPLPTLAVRNWTVPVGGVFSGVVGGLGGWLLASGFSNLRVKSIVEGEVLNGAHVPLWSNPRNAVNPDRAYFELADERNNEPLIFHSGLYFCPEIGPPRRQRGSFPTRSSAACRPSPTSPKPTTTTDPVTISTLSTPISHYPLHTHLTHYHLIIQTSICAT